MKTVFNIVLGLCVIALVYICYASIMGPINFENAKKHRDKAVVARLIDIRKAQAEYRNIYKQYTASFDTLIDFVKTQKIPFVSKEGVLIDKALVDGMTEKKAMAMIKTAEKSNNWKEGETAGLKRYIRGTIRVGVSGNIDDKSFNADSLRYVPFGGGAQFEMYTRNDTTKSGAPIFLFQANTPYDVYLNGLDKQEIANLKDVQTKLGKYPGLMVGSIDTPNNGAGNWE